ncbi:MAG: enoyl-CoA hydratase/isomerase family protein, partial [Rhizobium sp.]
MTSALVRLEKRRGFAQVILDRPAKRNALNIEMLNGLVDALRECQADPDVRAIVISGSERGFAAGADIGSLAAAGPIELYTSG